MGNSKNIKTEYGEVNRAKLEKLQESFDTRRLLDAIGLIDDIRMRICEPDGMRSELLDLHRMAMAVVNEDSMSSSNAADDEPIWSKANDLEFEISDYADKLSKLANLLEELSMLAPEDEWEDEDGEQ